MNSAWTIDELKYIKNFYRNLSGECKVLSVDSIDNSFINSRSPNCELLGTLINIFKDSTQISPLSNIVSNESLRSTLVNKAVTNKKCKLNDIARTVYATPAVQDFSNIGSGIVGSSTSINASISTSTSTISPPATIDERIYAAVKGKSTAAVIEKSGTEATDEKSETAPADERSGKAAVFERTGIEVVDKRTGTAAVDERSRNSLVDGRSETSAVDGRSETSAVDGRSETSAVDGGSETSAVDGRSETSAVDLRNRAATFVYEESKTSSVGVRNRIGTVVGARTGTPNFVRGNTESYKSQIKICKETNGKIICFNKPVNKNCPDTQSTRSSKLKLDENFDIKIKSKHTSDLEKFIETINLANSDMVRKSGKLFQKQNLVSEILSYIQATQSVCRLSLPRNIYVDNLSRDEKRNFDFSSIENFHSAGECILEELNLYLSDLKADFEDWEDKRIAILQISESIPRQFKLCFSESSTRLLMHEISTEICAILEEMNTITSRRERRNFEFTGIWEGIDRYIAFSSSFI